jgi:hypothetical protein
LFVGCGERIAQKADRLAQSSTRAGCETLSAVTGGIAMLFEWPLSAAFEAPSRTAT